MILSAMMPFSAQADGARDWVNVPIDTNFLFLYYTYSNTNASIDSTLPIDGINVEANVPIMRYARSFDLNGNVGGFQLVVPYGFVDAEIGNTRLNTSTNGIGDITAIFIANIFGAPSLTVEQFAHWKPETYLTSSMFITAPTGNYDTDSLLNIGQNRWVFKPQLSWGAPFDWGGLLSVNGNVQFFTDNKKHLGSKTLKQDPIYSIEAHYSQNFSKSFWASLDAFYSYGGRTSVDDVVKDNLQSTLKLGVSASYNFTPFDAITASWNSTVAKRDSTPSGQTFSINVSHGW